jgi:hypothetical protein
MQQIFRRYFKIVRQGKAAEHNTIKNWVQKFRTTASATNKKPEVWCAQRKTLKQHEPLLVVAPNNQHLHIQLPSTYRASRSEGYFILVYIFAPANYAFYENCQAVILLQEMHFVSSLLP